MVRCSICFLLITTSFVVSFNPNILGPFDIKIRHFEECSDPGNGDIRVYVRIKKISRKIVAADFNVTLNVVFDDRISIHFSMAQFTNGGYKANFFSQIFPKGCSTIMQIVPQLFTDVLTAMRAYKCPIKKGFYSAKDFTTNNSMKNVTMFYYNKYKSTVAFKRQGKLLGCFHIVADFVPKRKH